MTKAAHRVARILERALDTVVAIICILLLLLGVYSLLDNLWLYNHASDRSLLLFKPDLDLPLEQVQERVISENQVAWLSVYDTSIDYPIMQADDNYKYLNIDPYGDFSLGGSIFLDCRNDSQFLDDYSIIYGHHMERGVMFGCLDEYMDESYYEAHRFGRLVTKSTVYDFEIFAVVSGDARDNMMFDPDWKTSEQMKAYVEKKAMYYTPYETDHRIVALTTCAGDTETARLLVFGILKEIAQ